MEVQSPTTDVSTLLEFMFRLGQAYLACGEQTAKVELLLRRTATAYGIRRSRVVAFPTAVFISLHDGAEERVTLAEAMRLCREAEVAAAEAAAASLPAIAPDEEPFRLAIDDVPPMPSLEDWLADSTEGSRGTPHDAGTNDQPPPAAPTADPGHRVERKDYPSLFAQLRGG